MNKIFAALLLLGVTTGIALAGAGNHAECPFAKSKRCALCPEKMEGVKTVSRNTKKGVEITMSTGDKALVAKVQEMALVHYNAKDTMDPNCPARVEGAQVKITDTETGAKAEITGSTPEAVRRIQEASLKEHKPAAQTAEAGKGRKKEALKTAGYSCPMGCVTSDKPGKCTKCGMAMKEKKQEPI